ncbi:hypothetical protein D7B24_008175 [Verticillium nonalfalfae]|uniref:Uncharacterized protein n=1 Tax=Verticillium nonalfalfae TaxID=1051616 RepID=A0A3M9Y5L0_9PEZI|nr:uncharacterized protein D7B24_008175 [Verticillium nonalfalfae]RNJ55747.1 hypothetical protein D7B24_008175 [Verticillium nonalfalfae]
MPRTTENSKKRLAEAIPRRHISKKLRIDDPHEDSSTDDIIFDMFVEGTVEAMSREEIETLLPPLAAADIRELNGLVRNLVNRRRNAPAQPIVYNVSVHELHILLMALRTVRCNGIPLYPNPKLHAALHTESRGRTHPHTMNEVHDLRKRSILRECRRNPGVAAPIDISSDSPSESSSDHSSGGFSKFHSKSAPQQVPVVIQPAVDDASKIDLFPDIYNHEPQADNNDATVNEDAPIPSFPKVMPDNKLAFSNDNYRPFEGTSQQREQGQGDQTSPKLLATKHHSISLDKTRTPSYLERLDRRKLDKIPTQGTTVWRVDTMPLTSQERDDLIQRGPIQTAPGSSPIICLFMVLRSLIAILPNHLIENLAANGDQNPLISHALLGKEGLLKPDFLERLISGESKLRDSEDNAKVQDAFLCLAESKMMLHTVWSLDFLLIWRFGIGRITSGPDKSDWNLLSYNVQQSSSSGLIVADFRFEEPEVRIIDIVDRKFHISNPQQDMEVAGLNNLPYVLRVHLIPALGNRRSFSELQNFTVTITPEKACPPIPDTSWAPVLDELSAWLNNGPETSAFANVVAGPMTGKTQYIPRRVLDALSEKKIPDTIVIYALRTPLEKGLYMHNAVLMSEKVDDCVDGLLTESDAKLRVLTHRSLDKLMYFAETRRAVIILDHDPECSSLYVSIWLRIVEWAATAEYARIVTLSTVEMPEWQKNITDGVTIMRMNDFRCLGGEGYPMQPLEKAVDRNDIAELIGRFLKHDSPPRTLVIVGPIAMIMDASQLLPDEADFLITGISSKTDFNSFIAKSPLDSHQSPIVLVVAPNVALSAPALHALKLANVTHGGIIGHGAGGPCYNDFLGTVVDDSLTLPPSEVDIDRASMYWSKSLSTPFVPCWMPVDRRQYENSSSSLYERFANRDLYTTVYKLVDFISLTAFILSAAFYKSTSVEVKETLVYFAHIIANADACREAIEFVGQPPSESFRRIAIQDAIPGQFAPEGFLWTVLGFAAQWTWASMSSY